MEDRSEPPPAKRSLWPLLLGAIGLCLYVPILALAASMPAMLLVASRTNGGRLVAIGLILLLAIPVPMLLAVARSIRRLAVRTILVLAILAGASLITAYVISPTSDSKGGVSSHYIGDASFSRMSPANVVPETDQLLLGASLMASLDRHIDDAQARRVRGLFEDVYSEMRADEAFRDTPSALGMCYEDLLFGRRRELHFFQYIPRTPHDGPRPVLVFLHGYLGNFKGNLWVLKGVADETGCAIICPTFGAGDWRLDHDCSVLRGVHDHVAASPDLDESRVLLGGVSNGGLGVARGVRHGDDYRGLVLISPALESDVISSPEFLDHARDMPVLVLHGMNDRRIPIDAVIRGERTMADGGARLVTSHFPDEDHFLFFSKQEAVREEIARWMQAEAFVD